MIFLFSNENNISSQSKLVFEKCHSIRIKTNRKVEKTEQNSLKQFGRPRPFSRILIDHLSICTKPYLCAHSLTYTLVLAHLPIFYIHVVNVQREQRNKISTVTTLTNNL